MIRPLLKTVGARALRLTGADRLVGALRGREGSPLVVCYHRVVEDARRHPSSAPAMLVSTSTLERQLDWIGGRYQFLGLDELARGLESGRPFDRPVAAVTFDDGYADVYRHGLPLLRRKGIPFAVFLASDLVGTSRLHVHDELYVRMRQAARRRGASGLVETLRTLGVEAPSLEGLSSERLELRLVQLKEHLLETRSRHEIRALIRRLGEGEDLPPALRDELRAMSWEMIRELHRSGVTVGSHTRSHAVLPNEDRVRIRAELVESKRTLEAELGGEVPHLAYPGGRFCRASVEAASRAGYRYAYTTCHHRFSDHPLLTIPRQTFWERSAAGLSGSFSPSIAACQVQGVFDGLRRCPADHDPSALSNPCPSVRATGALR